MNWKYKMNDEIAEDMYTSELLRMTTEVVSAYVSNNVLPAGQIPDVIITVYSALSQINMPSIEEKPIPQKPSVPIRKSITDDYIICLEDGKKLKMLKRHLRSTYNITPDEYRTKWNLPPDYPMVAPNYAAQRSEFAKKIGLGRSGAVVTPRRRGRSAN